MNEKKNQTKQTTPEEEQNFDAKTELHPENMAALYEDPPRSRSERFRFWSLRNKRLVYGVLLLGLVAGFILLAWKDEPVAPEDYARDYFARFGVQKEDWAYKIGSFFITDAHLNRQYPLLLAYSMGRDRAATMKSDGRLFRGYLREQLETDLFVHAALREGILRNPEAGLILENGMRKLIAEYYLYSKLKGVIGEFVPGMTKAEVKSHYEKNRAFYEKNGLDQTRGMAAAHESLFRVKREKILFRMKTLRAGILNRLRDREGYRVKQPDRFR